MRRRARMVLMAWLTVATLLAGASPVDAVDQAEAPPPRLLAAGVPRFLADQPYETIFGALASMGVTDFLPTFQYQEVPEPLSLGREADFLPPCAPDSPAFAALRRHRIGLVVPGQILYPTAELPPLADDPLAALLACAGEGVVSAVYAVDEPAWNGASPLQSERLYARVKQIDPALPVLMVHAPLVLYVLGDDGQPRPTTAAEIVDQLTGIKAFSRFADVVGFDLYPIPLELSGFTAPGLPLVPTGYAEAIPAYLRWLQTELPDKEHIFVLQGFSYARLAGAVEADAAAHGRPPTRAELREMACLAWRHGAEWLAWWGQGLLTKEDRPLWDDVVAVSRGVTTDPVAFCAG